LAFWQDSTSSASMRTATHHLQRQSKTYQMLNDSIRCFTMLGEQQLCIQGSVQLGTTLAQLGMKCCKTEAIKSIDLSCHFGKCFFPQKASSVPRPSNSRGNELRICFGYGSYGSSHGELPAEFPPLTGTFFSNPCRFFGDAF
jgi:hypothetical protein